MGTSWVCLDTASCWNRTAGVQGCWWSTALQGHSPSSLQEQEKSFITGERQKSQPPSRRTGRSYGKLKVEQLPPNPQEEDGAHPLGHTVVQAQGGHGSVSGEPSRIYQGQVVPAQPACLLLWEHWAGDEVRAMGAIYLDPSRCGMWSPVVSLLAEWGDVARRRGEEQELMLQHGNLF